ncbi:metal-binding protein [Gloeocapsa sp. PCC 73106]|uniref:metal-binding protein n=1 Tax=Gloeocapsa sp. PCC 73106 TaxID=102232 RepID=UPI0002ABAD0D|nr:metal-binding protein [Gloeocapsa sp. PCC 73106]ELR98429.1 uncharacterized metal-binding protein [Gloeocapsa sp. PCC 73106]
MPSGSTHDRITLWTVPWLVVLGWYLSKNGKLALLLTLGFLFSGLMFGPDLDIYSVQFKRWGKLRFLWLPYQKLIKHRSLLSHGPILGTMIRVIYLLTIITLVGIMTVGIAQLIWGFEWNWGQFRNYLWELASKSQRNSTIAFYLGLELGSFSHSLSDWLVSRAKRRQKKPRNQKSYSKKSR